LLVLVVGSLLFFLVERGVNPEVPNYESAIWYSFVSMATVGYGDIVPITVPGRIIGVIIILTGMGYVSLVTATLAFSFIEIFRKASSKASEKIVKSVDTLNTHSVKQEEKMDQILKRMDEIEEKVDEMENKNQK